MKKALEHITAGFFELFLRNLCAIISALKHTAKHEYAAFQGVTIVWKRAANLNQKLIDHIFVFRERFRVTEQFIGSFIFIVKSHCYTPLYYCLSIDLNYIRLTYSFQYEKV